MGGRVSKGCGQSPARRNLKAKKIQTKDDKSQPKQTISNVAGVKVEKGGKASQEFHNTPVNIFGQANPDSTAVTSRAAVGIVENGILIQQFAAATKNNIGEETRIHQILQTIHENTWRKTAVNIGETFKADKFPQPDLEVYPQMAESPNFYTGNQKVRKPVYRKDKHFAFPTDDPDPEKPTISPESLLEKIREEKDKLGTLGIVAQAGAGKTTCMRRWARKTMHLSEMTTENGYTPSDTARFKIVHFLDMRCVRYSEETTLRDILFKDVFEDESDRKKAYDYLNNNQGKAIIFLDGLDQAQKAITDNDSEPAGPNDVASSANIFFNLLSRNLLPEARLVISSREHAAASLPDEAWFDEVITLTGFSEADAKYVFNAVTNTSTVEQNKVSAAIGDIQEDGSEENSALTNWDKLLKNSSPLLPFISTPAFLLFTAIVFNYDGTAPTCITALMAKVLDILQYSLNIQERKRIRKIIHKLKHLSYEGMERKLVMFSEGDLGNSDLEIEMIRDLLLMVPKSRSPSLHIINGDNVFYFSHQILQEFLSACFIVEMKLSDFKKFVTVELNKDHWSVVRRFVCGLIFTLIPIENLVQISNRKEKARYLRKRLIAHMETAWNYQLFELYDAIYESNDKQLIESVNFTSDPTHRGTVSLVSALLAGKKHDTSTSNNAGLDTNVWTGFVRNTESSTAGERLKSSCVNDGGRSFVIIKQRAFARNMLHNFEVERFVQRAFGANTSSSVSDHQKDESIDSTIKIDDVNWGLAISDIEKKRRDRNPNSVSLYAGQKLTTQYINHRQLETMKNWKIDLKVDELILSYVKFGDQREDSPQHHFQCRHDVSFLFEKFRAKVINIATSPEDMQSIQTSFKMEPRQLKFHVVAEVHGYDELQNLSQNLQMYEVESLRLVIDYKYTTNEIKSFMETLVKGMHVWIHLGFPCSINEQELLNEAKDIGTIVRIYRYQSVPFNDPWIWIENERATAIAKA